MTTPLQFARTLQQSLDYRRAGMSQIEAVTQACRTVGISPEWAMIVQLTLEASSTLAEDWCERQINLALDKIGSDFR
jgi:hypothetical protein